MLYHCERRIRRLYFLADSEPCVVFYPFCKIMQPSDIAHVLASSVSQRLKFFAEFPECLFPRLVGQRQSKRILNKCSAVELSEIYYKLLLPVHLQGACHLWYSYQLSCKKQCALLDVVELLTISLKE